MDMTYTYSGTNNNGQITQSVDAMTGETIVYQYDALKRLASATGLNWGENYGYDGFGNLTQMSPSGTAGAPTLSVTVDPTTNRLTPGVQVSYDNNGNMTQGGYLAYDVANRLKSAIVQGGTIYYGYDSANRRIYYRSTSNAETIYLYGADGKKLGIYTVASVTNTAIQFTQQSTEVYFAGRRLGLSLDRLGSVRYGGASGVGYQAEYPYGVEYTPTVNDREKYATYTRDSLTGLDYAVNRYYTSLWGRFLSPDRSWQSAKPGSPQRWNRYPYVLGDPINLADPTGSYYCTSAPGFTDPCPVAYGIMNGGEIGPGNDGDDDDEDDGGGCQDSSVSQFDPTPVPPGPNPCPPPAPPTPPIAPPTCALELEYIGAKAAAKVANHAAIVVQDMFGFIFTMEGFPTSPVPPWGNLIPKNTPGNIGYTQWGSTLTSAQDPALCNQISAIEVAEQYYSNHEVTYLAWGPNSNSFAHWLLESGYANPGGYVDQYFTAPPNTPGWNTPLYGAIP
jgi:RHS repeat-associated protein